MSTASETTIEVAGRVIPLERTVKIGALVVLLVLPFTLESYYTELIVRAYIFAIFALSVDLLWGYTGVLTFGHAAFFGLGAYVMAKSLELSPFPGVEYLALVGAIVLPGVVGLVVAAMLFHRGISGAYFTIITLAIAIVVQQTIISWNTVTGGNNGMTGLSSIEIGLPGVFMVPLEGFLKYYIILGVMLGALLFSRRIVHSAFGTALIAIRENETKARAIGYDIPKYKTASFALASGMAGFAGALYTGHTGFAAPGIVGFVLSTQVLLWVLIGGRGTLIGPIVGAFFLVLFEDLISTVFLFGWTLLLGLVLVTIVLVLPEGIMQFLDQVRERLFESS